MREGDLYNLLKGFGGVLSALALALEQFMEDEAAVGLGDAFDHSSVDPTTNAHVSAFFRQLSPAFAEIFAEFRV